MIETNRSVPQLAEEVRTEYRRRFGRDPAWIAVAPGRVNLIGEHTDYNDGFVLPMAIQRYVVLAGDRAQSPTGSDRAPGYTLCSITSGKTQSWSASDGPPDGKGHWTSYVWGVLDLCRQRGFETGPLDIVIHSTVPVGGGLSSSAALEVATATLVEAVTGRQFDPVEKALLCQAAEHEYAGVPCGIMDQFSSVLGRADRLILLDCRSRQVELVPLEDDQVSVLITNTNVKHALTGGEYAQRRGQCEAAAKFLGVPSLRDSTSAQVEAHQDALEPALFQRARHVVSEIERTTQAADAIRRADWPAVGQLMYASHQSLKHDYEVSCDELDLLVDLAQQIGVPGGVFGSRMTGAGFGGCTVSLVRTEMVESITQKMSADYFAKTRIRPTMFLSRPAEGAGVFRQE